MCEQACAHVLSKSRNALEFRHDVPNGCPYGPCVAQAAVTLQSRSSAGRRLLSVANTSTLWARGQPACVTSRSIHALACVVLDVSAAFPGDKAQFCSLHKEPGMVDVHNKRCEAIGCDKHPTYGQVNGRARFCTKHKDPEMVSERQQRYVNVLNVCRWWAEPGAFFTGGPDALVPLTLLC